MRMIFASGLKRKFIELGKFINPRDGHLVLVPLYSRSPFFQQLSKLFLR